MEPTSTVVDEVTEVEAPKVIKVKKHCFGGEVGNMRSDFTLQNADNLTPEQRVQALDTRRAFEKKHLHAFLKGHEYFTFGKDKNGYPVWYAVKRVACE